MNHTSCAITALIFDLDGLLADSERWHRQAYQEVFQGLGVELPDSLYAEHWIRNGKGIVDFISERGLDLNPADIRQQKAIKYETLVRSYVQPMPGAHQTLARFRPHKTLALATSSYPDSAYPVLETLGMTSYFTCIATKSSVERAKPFPDIFLWAASQLGVPPDQCVVLEDAEKGILAAEAAGMRSIAVPNEHTRDNDFSKATMVLTSLSELTPDCLAELG